MNDLNTLPVLYAESVPIVWGLNFRGVRGRTGKEFEKLESFLGKRAKNFGLFEAKKRRFHRQKLPGEAKESGRNCL